METYLLKSSILMSVTYFFYLSVLRNETYYNSNRIFLLFSIFGAFILPLVNFSPVFSGTGLLQINLDPVIIRGYQLAAGQLNGAPNNVLSTIYISGTVYFTFRFISGITRLIYLYSRFPKYNFQGFKAVVLDSDQAPFSFFNFLFLSRNDFNSGTNREIIVHEMAHRNGLHSLDVILVELATIVLWFNPFLWLMKISLQSTHEYIADNKVLDGGYNPAGYKKLLFEKSLGITSLNLANHFNYSLLKKRLKMMTIKKSKPAARLKYVFALPLIAFTLVAVNFNYRAYGQVQDESAYQQVDVMPTYNGGPISDIRFFIEEHLKYPDLAKENEISARIFVQFVVGTLGEVKEVKTLRTVILSNDGKEVLVEDYHSGSNTGYDKKAVAMLEAEAKNVVQSLKGFKPGQKDGKEVATQFTFPINFILNPEKK